MGTLVFAAAWYRAATGGVRLEKLTADERQELVEEMVTVSPGVHVGTWYEPRIGYTLRPGQEIELSFDTFQANEIGYRSGPVAKAPGTFRVVFVGDSWTFGSGVREEETFAKVFERIASRQSALDRRVEAWTLALSGYNTFNQLAAFWFFADRLQPDAVVICPTTNDHESGYSVLPTGSLTRWGKLSDQFGDNHPVHYSSSLIDSFRFRDRWRLSFQQIRETEQRLQELGIPMMIYFVARWRAPHVHYFVEESGLESPYVIIPRKFLAGRWLNPPPDSHGNAEANRVYGRIVYQAVAATLGWPRLPPAGDGSDVELFRHPPAGQDWEAQLDALLRRETRRSIPESFRPAPGASKQAAGPINPRTGRMGRSTTVLVRLREGARFLEIALERLRAASYLYPLQFTATIPSPDGGTRAEITVPAGGGGLHRFRVEIPPDLEPGTALDVVLEADRVTALHDRLVASSVFVKSIEQRSSQ